MPSSPRRSLRSGQRERAVYVETHAGWRAFFLCVLIAAVLGSGFRAYFSPTRLRNWVAGAIDAQKRQMAHPFALSFATASLRLSDGSWTPSLSLVLTDVRVAPSPDCRPEASVSIGELRLPFRVFALLTGRVGVGVVAARDLSVDLDGLRARCEPGVTAGAALTTPAAKKSVAETALQLAKASDDGEQTKPWWTPEQYDTVRGFIEGIKFSRATLQFESKTKEVYLDEFEALLRRNGVVEVSTTIRMPPRVTYNESLPPLEIIGTATSMGADATVRAQMSEGSLKTAAHLTPAMKQTLNMKAELEIKNLPLSTMSPLMRKMHIVNEAFAPKFLWLDAKANIEGPFQGLFQKSPFAISDIRIEGDGTDIQLKQALRSPEGHWKAFDVAIVSLKLEKLLETIGTHTPPGLFADLGTLKGDVSVAAENDALFKGQLTNTTLNFSNRKVRATQKIKSADMVMKLAQGRVTSRIDHVLLENGELRGSLAINPPMAELQIAKLVLDPQVQHVLTGGTLGEISVTATARLENQSITSFKALANVGATKALDFEFQQATVRAQREHEEPPKVIADSPSLTMQPVLESVYLGHEHTNVFDRPHIELEIEPEITTWTKVTASQEHGQIQFLSQGTIDRDHLIDGQVTVSFPKVKNLIFAMKGPLAKPVFREQGPEIKRLRERAEINDKALGF